MEITEVRIKLMEDSDDRLQGFCSITFDNCFVIRDLKIIEGTNGPFVAMPSRKLTAHCPKCRYKNHLRASFCNQCGGKLSEEIPIKEEDGRAKLYADIAHPINSECREMIQTRVISEFSTERERSQKPGYVSRYDDHYEDSHGHDSGANREQRSESRNRIQPPASEPRPPHRAQQKRPRQESSPSRVSRHNDDFGAGIL